MNSKIQSIHGEYQKWEAEKMAAKDESMKEQIEELMKQICLEKEKEISGLKNNIEKLSVQSDNKDNDIEKFRNLYGS